MIRLYNALADVCVSIPVIHPKDDVEITILSGNSHGTSGSVTPVGGAWYLGFKLQKPGASVYQPLPEGYNAFIYSKSC